jgi:DNA polymerase-4
MFVSSSADILHADLDAFYASVEQRDHPWLRNRPVIVGAGVVLSASYQARARGVRTAMGGRMAMRLCPDAIVVSPRMEAYSTASKAVFEVFRDTTPIVEPLSIDEAFLDVGGLRKIRGQPRVIAADLRDRVRSEVGLPISVGVARTKFLAKVASRVAKPDGLLVVPPDQELAFLHPLPVEQLWGVGKVTAEKLRDRGLRTVADVAELEPAALVAMLGRASGHHLYALAHNLDPRPVVVGRRRGSMGAQRAMGRGRWTEDQVEASLAGLVDRVTRRLRKANRTCRTVILRLRFDDFARITRSHTLASPTDATAPVLTAARTLLAQASPLIRERGLTLVGITLTNLDADGALQLELPFGKPTVGLDGAVDSIRERFGSSALTRGALLGRGTGFTVPLLPDD